MRPLKNVTMNILEKAIYLSEGLLVNATRRRQLESYYGGSEELKQLCEDIRTTGSMMSLKMARVVQDELVERLKEGRLQEAPPSDMLALGDYSERPLNGVSLEILRKALDLADSDSRPVVPGCYGGSSELQTLCENIINGGGSLPLHLMRIVHDELFDRLFDSRLEGSTTI